MRQWVTLTAAVALVAATAACSHRNATNTSTSAPSYSGSTMTAPGQDVRHGGSTTQSLGVAPPGGDTSSTSGGDGSGGAAGAGGGAAGGAGGAGAGAGGSGGAGAGGAGGGAGGAR